jgi:hypothetical protein
MSGQANHEADPEDPVQGPLPGSLLPKLGQVREESSRVVDRRSCLITRRPPARR